LILVITRPASLPLAEPTKHMISVIMPAYNAESSIGRAVDSALSQEGVEVEVLVVDDCSTDRTAALVAEAYGNDARVRLLSTGANAGQSVARNLAIDAARGEWVTFLDSDDWMETGRLGLLTGSARELGYDLLADPFYLFKPGAPRPHAVRFKGAGADERPPVAIDAPRLVRFGMGAIKPVVKRSFLDKTGIRFDPGLRYSEDMLFFARIMMHGAVAGMLNRPMYHREDRDNTVSKQKHSLFAEQLRAFDLLADEFPDARHADLHRALQDRARVVRDAESFAKVRDWLRHKGAGPLPADWVRAFRHLLFRGERFSIKSLG
jgi:glycosyltransferase involved in cell wall biosynthesis